MLLSVVVLSCSYVVAVVSGARQEGKEEEGDNLPENL
jgi:hypothetical protein